MRFFTLFKAALTNSSRWLLASIADAGRRAREGPKGDGSTGRDLPGGNRTQKGIARACSMWRTDWGEINRRLRGRGNDEPDDQRGRRKIKRMELDVSSITDRFRASRPARRVGTCKIV